MPNPESIILRIVANCTSDSSREISLGSSVTPGNYAALCANQILVTAANTGLDPDLMMAYAAAHEIGHLLMGRAHRDAGIMRAIWERNDIRAMAKLELCFSKEEKLAMRRYLLAAGASSAVLAESSPQGRR
ncbi:MAG: hypothetical protein U0Q18_11420 [Bryobacteraceae bacterium]